MPIELLLALGRWVAAVLRVGTLCAVLLVAVGYAWSAVAGQPRRGARPLLGEIAEGGGDGVTALGLLALTLIPILVLGAAAIAFRRAGERRMAAAAVAVGTLLIASLVAATLIGPAI